MVGPTKADLQREVDRLRAIVEEYAGMVPVSAPPAEPEFQVATIPLPELRGRWAGFRANLGADAVAQQELLKSLDRWFGELA